MYLNGIKLQKQLESILERERENVYGKDFQTVYWKYFCNGVNIYYFPKHPSHQISLMCKHLILRAGDGWK